MTNAEKFQLVFNRYATEIWALPEKDFLEWLNKEYSNALTPKNWKAKLESVGKMSFRAGEKIYGKANGKTVER